MSLDALIKLAERTEDIPQPPSGSIYLAFKSGAIQYRDSTNNLYVLATGLSFEDVQDIIGTILADSATVNLIYDDNGNIVTAEVIQSAIDHTQISNRGNNTHTQIDAHINSTSNPHNTTAAQIGADPVGSAQAAYAAAISRANHTGTQSANSVVGVSEHLANTSNPHNTTAAQIGADPVGSAQAAYAAAINRANHTGTQGANTISDFAGAVRTTPLTGFTVGTNTEIIATDSLLQSLGKTQGQIDAVKATVLGQILGDQFQQFLDDTPFATTSLTNVVAATFTTTAKPAGTYRIGWKYNWAATSVNQSAIFGLYLDGVLLDREVRFELSDNLNTPVFADFAYAIFPSTTTHTLELRVRNSGNQTVTVNSVRAEIWRVN